MFLKSENKKIGIKVDKIEDGLKKADYVTSLCETKPQNWFFQIKKDKRNKRKNSQIKNNNS